MRLSFVSVPHHHLVARLNLGMAVFYGLLGLFGLSFIGGTGGTAATTTYLAIVLALVSAHALLGWGSRRGYLWAKYGSVAGCTLLVATAYYGVFAGPLLGFAIAYYALKPWDPT